MSKLYSNKKQIIEILTSPFIGEDSKYHYVYTTYNPISKKEYTGVVSETNYIDSKYIGSSNDIDYLDDIVYVLYFKIISFHKNRELANIKECKIVNVEYTQRLDTYNITVPNIKFNAYGIISLYDFKKKKTCSMKIGDPRLITGRFLTIGLVNKNTKETIEKLRSNIYKYNKNRELIKSYSNIMEASQDNNISNKAIKMVCDDKRKSVNGHIYIYDGDCLETKLKGYHKSPKQVKKIIYQYTLEGILVDKFNHTDMLPFNRSSILTSCNNSSLVKRNTYKNFIWVFKTDVHLIDKLCILNNSPRTHSQSIAKIDIITGEVLKIYCPIVEITKDGFHRSGVLKVCKGEQGSAQGFKWKIINN